jgi:hypothetical protein
MRANAKNLTVEIGTKFAEALVSEKYAEAQSYLIRTAQQEHTPKSLEASYKNMVAYGNGPIRVDGHFEFLGERPARKPQDLGWVYISISGSDFAEAVSVVVSEENGAPRIRAIEWGRP